jgi:hypothetical protein
MSEFKMTDFSHILECVATIIKHVYFM